MVCRPRAVAKSVCHRKLLNDHTTKQQATKS